MSKLPYRVAIQRRPEPGWTYICPGCWKAFGSTTWSHVMAMKFGVWHASRCPRLRRLNFEALRCWNCRGTGLVSGDLCLVCLGARITTEPDPTKERHV